MSNSKLVWSDDPKDKKAVEENLSPKKPLQQDSAEKVKSLSWTAVFRLEKSGRGGKTVTVIDQLPRQELFLKELCQELKTKCGSGGKYSLTAQESLIEIQGDKRQEIKKIFDRKGFKYKGM